MEDEFIDLSAFQISPEDQAKIAAIQRDEAAKRKGAIRRRRQDDLFVQITHQDAIAGFAALDRLSLRLGVVRVALSRVGGETQRRQVANRPAAILGHQPLDLGTSARSPGRGRVGHG